MGNYGIVEIAMALVVKFQLGNHTTGDGYESLHLRQFLASNKGANVLLLFSENALIQLRPQPPSVPPT